MLTESRKAGNIYRDIIFFIIAIPIINAFNYYLTYTKISFNSHTLLTFLIDTVEGYAAWWAAESVRSGVSTARGDWQLLHPRQSRFPSPAGVELDAG